MKPASSFLLLSLLLVLGAALALYGWQRPDLTRADNSSFLLAITKLTKSFQQKHSAQQVIHLEELRQARANRELWEPETALPRSQNFPYVEIAQLYRYSKDCKTVPRSNFSSRELRKAFAWQKFLCGAEPRLPANFFATEPFMHPSGFSYAWLARQTKKAPFNQPDWIQSQFSKFHLLEILRESILGGPGLQLSAWDLRKLLNSERLVFTGENIFVATPSEHPKNQMDQYLLYKRSDWEAFIAKKNLVVASEPDSQTCAFKEGSLCWRQNPAYKPILSRSLTILLILVLVVFIVINASLAVKLVRRRKEEAATRLFTLQMLTHELRTPATALRLSLETFRRDFDRLPNQTQKAFLQMCEELQRLDRIVEASKTYLRTEPEDRLLNPSADPQNSVNELVASALESYGDKVLFTPLKEDKYIGVNRYWLELCLKNLVDNAVVHGKAPVTVNMKYEQNSLECIVQDQGELSPDFIARGPQAFRKSASSRGLGLGLTIVARVVRSLNGELHYKSSPTTFWIKLKGLA